VAVKALDSTTPGDIVKSAVTLSIIVVTTRRSIGVVKDSGVGGLVVVTCPVMAFVLCGL
jgi:hypothetical protein